MILPRLRRFSVVLALLVIVISPVAFDTASAQESGITVDASWARASIGTNRPTAAYLTIRNQGSETDFLLAIETAVAGSAEVHEMTMENGVARMGAAGAVEIPANAEVKLEPGGLHIMLMGLTQALTVGETFEINLTFREAGSIAVDVPILPIGASGPTAK